MTVLHRHALKLIALAAVFSAGWAAAGLTHRPAIARTDVGRRGPAGSAPVTDDACLDRHAMEANANLVDQVHDYRKRAELAKQRAETAERALTSIAQSPPARLVTSRDEWARMAREGTIRMRVPCSHWNARPRYFVSGNGGMSHNSMSGGFGVESRAEAAGLSAEELELLGETYQRAHTKTWAAMRSTCEASASFRAFLAEHEQGDDMTDEVRVSSCADAILDMKEASTRTAIGRVAELRAAGAGIERTSGDAQRVAYAMTSGQATLFEEMVRALGREKATRAIDNGVVCLDETVYDLREPAREESSEEPVDE